MTQFDRAALNLILTHIEHEKANLAKDLLNLSARIDQLRNALYPPTGKHVDL